MLTFIVVVAIIFVLFMAYYVNHKEKPMNPHFVPKTHWQKSSPYSPEFDTSELADQILIK